MNQTFKKILNYSVLFLLGVILGAVVTGFTYSNKMDNIVSNQPVVTETVESEPVVQELLPEDVLIKKAESADSLQIAVNDLSMSLNSKAQKVKYLEEQNKQLIEKVDKYEKELGIEEE